MRSGQCGTVAKFDNDAAVQVAEEAFVAGWRACLQEIKTNGQWQAANSETEFKAWCDFEPSEAIKDLVDGD